MMIRPTVSSAIPNGLFAMKHLSRRSLMTTAGVGLITRPAIARNPFVRTGGGASDNAQRPGPLALQGAVHHIAPPSSAASIQAVINAAASGDTIFFDPGTFNIAGGITLKSNLLYIGNTQEFNGQARAILSGGSIIGDVTNATIYGLTFASSPITINSATNFNITNCFLNGLAGDHTSQLSPNGWTFSTIQWCTFNDGGGIDGGGNGVNCDNLTITRNRFISAAQPISLNPGNNQNANRNMLISFNYMTNVYRMGIEINGTDAAQWTTNLKVNDNYYDGLSTSPINTGDVQALSIVPGETSTVTEIARNFIYYGPGADFADSLDGHIYLGYGIEFDGGAQSSGGHCYIHDNILDGRSGNSSGGWDNSIFGPYTNVAHVIQNNNIYTTRGGDVVAGSNAIISGTTHNFVPKPPQPAGGAGL